jgi:methionine-rich copper-binding protein CopC
MNLLLNVLLSATMFFHAELKSSIPARGAVLTQSPAQVTLVFSEQVNMVGTSASILKGDSSAVVRLALHAGTTRDTVRGAVTQTLAPGKYLIKWRAAAADDGHRTSGFVPFTVK